MSSLALYRKYRSADFSEVVGQQHVVRTLQNAISAGKHSHAYLLTGPRGVGKTTIARIIAKQINGLGKNDELNDNLDIIEIDGASNRGIDEIRSLREKIFLTPTKLKYKVYIIDEVHMLTKEAFNALLKTLEEPPEHAVFIFATTEANKLPDTIISRTQRFDLRPIQKSDMLKQLSYIAAEEKIDIDNDALELIGRISRGGFRDAIGLMDQISSTEGKITTQTVEEFTGLQDPAKLEVIIEARQKGQPDEVIKLLKELFDAGAEPAIVTQQLLDMVQGYVESAEGMFSQDYLLELAEQLHWVQTGLKLSTVPQLLLITGLCRKPTPTNTLETSTKSKSSEVKQPAIQQKAVSNPTSTEGDDGDTKTVKALSVIKHYNNSLYAVLRGSQLSVEGDEVRVVCRFSFHKERLAEPRNRTLIEKAFSKVYGEDMHVSIGIEEANQPEKVDKEQELMSSAMAILGGEVVDG